MKIRIDPLFSLILGAVLGFLLSTFVLPNYASASESNEFFLTSNGLVTIYQPNDFPFSTPGANTSQIFYKGIYPDRNNSVGGSIAGGSFTGDIAGLFEATSVYCTGGDGQVICDLESMFGTLYGDGNYWVSVYKNDQSQIYDWYEMTRDNGQWSTTYTFLPGFSSQARNTKFLTGNVTASSSNPKDVHFNISYYLDPLEQNTQISALNAQQIQVSWAVSPTTVFSSRGFNIASTTGTSTVRLTIPASDFPNDGLIEAVVRFSNPGCLLELSDCPFTDAYLYLTFTMNNSNVTSSTTVENYNTVNLPVESEVCSLGNFSGCINNSLVYLFVPSQNVLDGFLDVRTQLDSVKPFGYFTRILTAVGGVNASTTGAYTMPDIPFQTAIFDPLRNTMGVILWGVFAFVFYNKRLKNIDI